METGEQHDSSLDEVVNPLEVIKEEDKKKRAEWLQPWQFKKGQSGNPEGRKPGKSLKEYAKEMLASMTDDERQEYLKGINKNVIWEMAEGKAQANTDITSGGKPLILPAELINKNVTSQDTIPSSPEQTQI